MRTTSRAALLCVCAGWGAAVAQVADLRERLDDSYLPAPADQGQTPAFSPRGGPFTRQVNVNAAGMNVTGDAANEPSIASDPRAPNRIVIGYRQFDTIASNFRQAGYAWSNDGGRTWTRGVVEPGVFRTDPVLRANADGAIYWNMLLTDQGGLWRCDVYRSDDGGRTWGSPAFALGGDKAWIAVDRTVGPGRGFIHQVWNTAGNQYFPNQYNRSIDGNTTWTPPQELPRRVVFGTNYVGPSGELYVIGQSGGVFGLKSLNANGPGPVTFSVMNANTAIFTGPSGTGQPPNPAGLLGQHQVVVDSSGGARHGWIYALSTVQGTAGDASDVAFRRSRDGGATWDPIVRFNAGIVHPQSYQWFGTISVSPNGRLDVVYNDTSSTLAANTSRLMYVTSADGGATWSAPEAMGPVWNSHLGWPNQQKIGDYYDMESDLLGANVAYAATYNGEQDAYFLRIGPHDCDADGISDEDEVAAGAADCDADGIPDACEVAAGSAADSDGDGVIDACEPPCDAIDFNGDGLFPDNLDLFDYLSVFGGGPCSTGACGDIDFNNDGLFPDNADITALFRVFGGGGC